MSQGFSILHLSDFHAGKNPNVQRLYFQEIVSHVKERGAPDLVAITGDVAHKGTAQDYQHFVKDFLKPLKAAMGGRAWKGKILVVPGNHDVDRTQAEDLLDFTYQMGEKPNFFGTDDRGNKARAHVLPRFQAFIDANLGNVKSSWLAKPQGFGHTTLTHGHLKLGFVLLNTAWLSHSDGDQHQLGPGHYAVMEALNKLSSCDLIVMLGHHPLSWWRKDQAASVAGHWGKSGKLIYLYGHVHEEAAHYHDHGLQGFHSLAAGAAYQAEEDRKWSNGFQWLELDPAQAELVIRPFTWDITNKIWVAQSVTSLSEKYRKGPTDWALPLCHLVTDKEPAINPDPTYNQNQVPDKLFEQIAPSDPDPSDKGPEPQSEPLNDDAASALVDEMLANAERNLRKALASDQLEDFLPILVKEMGVNTCPPLLEQVMAAARDPQQIGNLLESLAVARGAVLPADPRGSETQMELWEALVEVLGCLLLFCVERSQMSRIVGSNPERAWLRFNAETHLGLCMLTCFYMQGSLRLEVIYENEAMSFLDDHVVVNEKPPLDGGQNNLARTDINGLVFSKFGKGCVNRKGKSETKINKTINHLMALAKRERRVPTVVALKNPDPLPWGIHDPKIRAQLRKDFSNLTLVTAAGSHDLFIIDEEILDANLIHFFNFKKQEPNK